MTIIIDTGSTILPLLRELEKHMADLTTDIQNLTAIVASVAADVAQVLQTVANAGNVTPAQTDALEAQIAALQQLDQTIKAAIPQPAPTA